MSAAWETTIEDVSNVITEIINECPTSDEHFPPQRMYQLYQQYKKMLNKGNKKVLHDYHGKSVTKEWTLEEANKLIGKLAPICKKYGYNVPKIVGGVKTRGKSFHDLDLVMTPVDPDGEFDFESWEKEVEHKLGVSGDFTYQMANYEMHLDDGRIVDIFFEDNIMQKKADYPVATPHKNG